VIRYDRRFRLLAACLSAVAGYVDGLGFIALGGLFVSFMSGNSTRLGVGLVEQPALAFVALGLIGCFVAGVAAGTLAGHFARGRRSRLVLGLVALLLALAAALGSLDMPGPALALMAAAMGAENAVFQRDGEVAIGLTYMTGTLVKMGQRLAAIPLGGDPLAFASYMLLWLGLVAGALLGALAYASFALGGLWIAAGAVAVLALAAPRIEDPASAGRAGG